MAKKENKYKDYNKHKQTYTPTGLAQYLGLGRPIDYYNTPTRLALLLSILAGMIEVFYQGAANGLSSTEAITFGANAGFSFLFSFMLAAELDPDRRIGGLIGGFLSVLGVHFLGIGNIIVLLWLLWILRMLNRTAGDRHRMVDDIIILGCAWYLGVNEFWLYPVLTAAAFIAEALLPVGYFGSYFLAAMAFATTFFAKISFQAANLSSIYILIGAVAFILFLPELKVATFCQALGDKDGQELYKLRLWASQGCFIMILLSLIIMHGDKQAITNLPAIMASIGTGIYLIYDLVVNKTYKNIKRR